MSNDSNLTVAGYVGSEPRFFSGEGDSPDYVSFRLATTRSYFNRAKNMWIEGTTTWFTVKAWRTLAKNTNDSIAKGDAVIVQGILDTQKWTSQDGTQRETLVIDAQAIGPNLARGTAKFRPNRNATQEQNNTSPSTLDNNAEPIEAELSRFHVKAGRSQEEIDQAASLAMQETSTHGDYNELGDESLTNSKKDESKELVSA